MLRTFCIALAAIVYFGSAATSAFACNVDRDTIWLVQSNATAVVFNRISQRGEQIDGAAKFRNVRGDFTGVITAGGRFSVTVNWDDGSRGVYTAFITPDGKALDGRTFDANNPSNFATWRLSTPARLSCN